MGTGMARRFDPLFPEMGGLQRLGALCRDRSPQETKTVGDTFFRPDEVEHIKKVLCLLGDDDEAKATIMSIIAFAQMKNDVAGF